ncbi:MAG: MATE family efflux transporter [Eubacteriaceae bacterium]|nr:MATE family efflux transporter [Eubacteriaceae bacterium]
MISKQNKYSLTSGDITRAIVAFVLPMMLGSLIQQLYTVTDSVIVGQFTGKAGLASINAIYTLFKFPLNFMSGLSAGATILISGAFGAGDAKDLNRSIQASLAVAAVLGLVFSAGGVMLTPWLMRVMKVPDEILYQSSLYSRIFFGGMWAMVIYNMGAGILRATGDTRRPLYVLILCSAVNIAGDLLLVGVLHMGVGGAAAATVAAQAISAATMLKLLDRMMEGGIVSALKEKLSASKLGVMIRKGLPLGIQSMLFPIANSIIHASVNAMGTDVIAAWSIVGKADMLIWLIADSMSPALTTYTAQNIGAKQWNRVRKGAVIGTLMSAAAVAFVSLVIYLGIDTIGRWFISASDAGDIMPLVVHIARMMCPFYFFYSFAEGFSGASCGMGDTVRPMITTLTSICLLRVLSIWFILPHFGTIDCITWIYIASWIAAGASFSVMFSVRVRRLLRQNTAAQ